MFRSKEDPGSDRLCQVVVDVLVRILIDLFHQVELSAIAQTGELLQCLLGF